MTLPVSSGATREPVCARCGLAGNLLDLDTGSVCHPAPSQCIALLLGEVERLREQLVTRETVMKGEGLHGRV
jgi:hypothetical protein